MFVTLTLHVVGHSHRAHVHMLLKRQEIFHSFCDSRISREEAHPQLICEKERNNGLIWVSCW